MEWWRKSGRKIAPPGALELKAIFLRALEETSDKDRVLREAIFSPARALGCTRFEIDPKDFGEVPRSPFAYWVSDAVRAIFTRLPPFEAEERTVKQGLATADDFRFVRLWLEVAQESIGTHWYPLAKGGEFSPYYSDVLPVVDWAKGGESIRNFVDASTGRLLSRPQNLDYFFRPGMTWPLRGIRFSSQAVPANCIFSIAGKMAFTLTSDLAWMLGLFNSLPFDKLIALFAGKVGGVQYEVGLIQSIPVPLPDDRDKWLLGSQALQACSLKRSLDLHSEISHAFHFPSLLRKEGESLSDRAGAWGKHAALTGIQLASLQTEIDDRCFKLYGIDGTDREQIEHGLGSAPPERVPMNEAADEEGFEPEELDPAPQAISLLSWAVGVAFGRFDLRLANGQRDVPSEPAPFDPLPVCSPGMLTGRNGLPLDEPPEGYAIDFPRDGILIDDAGTDRDLVTRVRHVIDHVFEDPAARWEEAAEILGEQDRTLRDWFSQHFFALHLKRYSKSRRLAPIYWPLATESGSYTVWIYYPRLAADTIFRVVSDHLDPKLQMIQEQRVRVEANQDRAKSHETAKLTKRAGELAALAHELEEMKAELLRVAQLPYKPNQNDGVQVTAAPLWRLFRHSAWRKVLEGTWKRLEKGELDWAHLAYAAWPERVRQKCKADRSLAIAHGLETELFKGSAVSATGQRKGRS